MAEVKTEQDPSIEEILESIRQIISDDSGAEAKPAAAKPEAVPQPAPPQPAPQQPMEKVLDLTEKVAPPPPVAAAPAPAPAVPAPQPPSAPDGAALLSNATTEAATAAMSKLLAGNVAVEREAPGKVGSITFEEMTRDLMRPLVKSWLDQNLPQIIEKMVQKEIEKISRRAMDR